MIVATSSFWEVIFGLLIMGPIILLWIAALVDVLRSGEGGLRVAAIIVLILIVPILGPILYFVFRKPTGDAEKAHLADVEMRREAARRSGGSTGFYN